MKAYKNMEYHTATITIEKTPQWNISAYHIITHNTGYQISYISYNISYSLPTGLYFKLNLSNL